MLKFSLGAVLRLVFCVSWVAAMSMAAVMAGAL